MARPNILWLMSDQHNAACLGAAGHPDVRTPNLDALAADGVRFENAFCNNPICAPSRISMIAGQYPHTTGVTGNDVFDIDVENPGTLATFLRRHGYQTALIGKGHMIGSWDRDGFEHIRYCDLCDAERDHPRSCHYFDHLVRHGLADKYDLGSLPAGHPGHGMRPFVSEIPHEHSVENWTGNQAVEFLQNRDRNRPFFMQLSFQRPHDPYAPSPERASLYDPAALTLPDNAADLFENRFGSKPTFQQAHINCHDGEGYPYVPRSEDDLRTIMAHYFALITIIDEQIGSVIDSLKQSGDYENTVICYVADHGDFAGEHGLQLKNLGIYESIHRIPFLLRWPGGPRGSVSTELVEGVDLYPTLCELAGFEAPAHVEGRSVVPVVEGKCQGHDAVVCEWDFAWPPQTTVFAARTENFRLVYYLDNPDDGELYDRREDPGEMQNHFNDPACRDIQLALTQHILNKVGRFRRAWDFGDDAAENERTKDTPTTRIHKKCARWSEVGTGKDRS